MLLQILRGYCCSATMSNKTTWFMIQRGQAATLRRTTSGHGAKHVLLSHFSPEEGCWYNLAVRDVQGRKAQHLYWLQDGYCGLVDWDCIWRSRGGQARNMRRATIRYCVMSSLEGCGALLLKTATTATGMCAMALRHELRCAAAYDGYKQERVTTTAQRAFHRRLGGERCCP